MEDITKMAECLRDVCKDDDDNDLEDKEDFLGEIQEVVVKRESEESDTHSSPSSFTDESYQDVITKSPLPQCLNVAFVKLQDEKGPLAAPGSYQNILQEGINMYKTVFLQHAKTAEVTTLPSALSAVKKERPVSKTEISPGVAPGPPSPVPTSSQFTSSEDELEMTTLMPGSVEEQTKDDLLMDCLGHSMPHSAKLHDKIVNQFKKNVPQCKIAKNLGLSPSTVHDIVKRFKESGGTSRCKGQGRRPKLNECEAEIPPPVTTGVPSAPCWPVDPQRPQSPVPTPLDFTLFEDGLEATTLIPGTEDEQTSSECVEDLFVVGLVRGSPHNAKLRDRIVEQFKKNIPQRKIAKNLGLSPSTVHNIVKRFRESGGTSLRKGQGRKPLLNKCEFQAFREHCMTNPDATVVNIVHWARDYFGKPISVNTVRRYIQTCK
ncbi:uncharacterized protein LOC115438015 [Sphaeramia orbicularis]|uniref:uncharacterized protein LOC115438015 n=1 Tax=Sphaeramia orbicularis TaxID=375764 RepID=UPI001180DE70|nr:uncharacterized protein LOC115438015 [Sphaeramia orbicularis]